MEVMTFDSVTVARRISALKSAGRNLEETLGAMLDIIGNDDYPLDEVSRAELMRLMSRALVMIFTLLTAFDEFQACLPL